MSAGQGEGGSGGAIDLTSGASKNEGSTSGSISILTADVAFDDGATGDILLSTGDNIKGKSGSVILNGGSSSGSGSAGRVEVHGGDAASGAGGAVSIAAGSVKLSAASFPSRQGRQATEFQEVWHCISERTSKRRRSHCFRRCKDGKSGSLVFNTGDAIRGSAGAIVLEVGTFIRCWREHIVVIR